MLSLLSTFYLVPKLESSYWERLRFMLMHQVGLPLNVFVTSPSACGKGDCFITNVLLEAARLRGEGKAFCRSTVRSLGEHGVSGLTWWAQLHACKHAWPQWIQDVLPWFWAQSKSLSGSKKWGRIVVGRITASFIMWFKLSSEECKNPAVEQRW